MDGGGGSGARGLHSEGVKARGREWTGAVAMFGDGVESEGRERTRATTTVRKSDQGRGIIDGAARLGSVT